MNGPAEDETLDPILRGLVRVLQRKKGYRFSVDAVLLADFAAAGPHAHAAAELGTGSGVVALLLAALGAVDEIVGLELQPGLAELARRSVVLNGLEGRVRIVLGDLKDPRALPRQTFDLVVANPPFRAPESGDTSPATERALARHELAATLEDVLRATKRLTRSNGRACFVYPAARLADLCASAVGAGLPPRRLRLVHPRAGSAAELCLVELRPGKRAPLEVGDPLFLYDASGASSAALRRILREEAGELGPGGQTLPKAPGKTPGTPSG